MDRMTLKKHVCLIVIGAALLMQAQGQSAVANRTLLPAPTPAADWSIRVKPFRIVGNIYYVGSKGLAAYLIDSPDGAVLLDGTTAANAALVEQNIHALGVPLHSVKVLISDHAHHDHVGALAKIKADTGARFVASEADVWALEHGQPRGENIYQRTSWPPIKVDQVIHDHETIRVGNVVLTANLTPGHTPGCTSWSTTVREGRRSLNVLFLCSITVAGNVLEGNRAYPDIAADYRKTFQRLRTMKADVVLPSHPDVANVMEREARQDAGDVNAFIDPTALSTIVEQSNAEFERSLKENKQQSGTDTQ